MNYLDFEFCVAAPKPSAMPILGRSHGKPEQFLCILSKSIIAITMIHDVLKACFSLHAFDCILTATKQTRIV
ncbi:hypothetical protein [Brucella sp. 2716]|uniref:hypothetical protein n=1 Tax=Brucella sp. 2716 TaxID=2975052 RepID=UPI002877709B|nr:hypothetical protein [Brucella sp. 2716]